MSSVVSCLSEANNTPCVVPGYSESWFTLLTALSTTLHDCTNFTLTTTMIIIIIIIIIIASMTIPESEMIAAAL
jgi:hypothetical protein